MTTRVSLFLFLFIFSVNLFAAKGKKTAKKKAPFDAVWAVRDFEEPESVYFDQEDSVLYVSNISGAGDKKDGKGWIAKLHKSGKMLNSRWVKGLNAPKGMRSYKNFLYVSDIDRVVKIDKKTAKIVREIPIKGAQFLNDVAVDARGNVYVSDTLGSAIYILRKDQPSVFVKGPEWDSPNGLLVQRGSLVVAAWGLTKDWKNKSSGYLYRINLKTRVRENISRTRLGNLDGLEVHPEVPNMYYVSDWVNGKVFSVLMGKVFRERQLTPGSADIALIPQKGKKPQVIVPRMKDQEVLSVVF